MPLFRVIVELEVEADNEEEALRVAQNSVSSAEFETCISATEVPVK